MGVDKIPIVDMEATTNDQDVSKVIARLAWGDISDLVSWVIERKPYAIIPPYSNDIRFTARCAASVRDRLPYFTRDVGGQSPKLLCAVGRHDAPSVREFLAILRDGGFTNFALRPRIGETPAEHLFPIVGEGLWFHVAGAEPKGSLAGKWTWSEEGL